MSKIIDQNFIIGSSKSLYQKAVINLKESENLSNDLMVPSIKVIHLSVGAGKFFKNSADMEKVQKALSLIAGQHAVMTVARKSVASFDVREGMKTGLKVTLRKDRMFEFLDRLKLIYLPRVRDFQGFDFSSFNGKSFSIGIKDAAAVFPEIISIMNTYDFTFGLNITMVFNIESNKLQAKVLQQLGFPFLQEI